MKQVLVVGDRATGRNANYYNALEAVGARAIACDQSLPGQSVARCDAVLIPGGVDICPSLYGQQDTACRDRDAALDAVELAVIRAAVERKKPVLGICRGLQMLNVYFGGTLVQNVARCDLHERDGETDRAHETTLEPGSFLRDLYGQDVITVNSAHHQAIGVLASGFVAVQHSRDGIIEAIAHKTLPILAVQWHPERMCLANARADTVDGLAVFRHFVDGITG